MPVTAQYEYVVYTRFKQQQQQIDYDRLIELDAPNRLQKDGRIYATDDDGNYVAVSVNVLHPFFKTQIEKGIWPIVDLLVKKGYLTISSCEGHDGSPCYVKLVFPNQDQAESFIDNLFFCEGVFSRIEMTSANVVRAIDTMGVFHYRNTEHENEFNHKAELDGINQLFSRNYTDFRYVYIEIYPEPTGFLNFIKRLLFGNKSIITKREEIKTHLLKTIKGLPDYDA